MRNKTIRTIQVLTMGLPIIVYVWLSATLFNVKTSVNITLNNNTIVLEKLLTKLDIDEHTNGEA